MSQSNPANDSLQAGGADSKLVSVICRTIIRPELQQALQSVADQSYPDIELVLVDALGAGIPDYENLYPGENVKLVSLGKSLRRSRAANVGMTKATGDYLMFLDDDDWIDREHIANLVTLLDRQSEACAAYSATRKVDASGQPLDYVFGQEFSAAQLKRGNYIPIHSMLFEASLFRDGCKFDENLEIYEDWDFWLQVSQHSSFLHSDRVTAFYREGGESETAVNIEQAQYTAGHPNALAREKVLAKWLPRWSAAEVNQMLGTMDQSGSINELRDNVKSALEVIHAREEELAEITGTAKKLGRQLTELHKTYARLDKNHTQLDRSYAQQISEFSKLADKHEVLSKDFRALHLKYHRLDRSYAQQISEFSKLADKHEVLSKDFRALHLKYHRLETQHKKLDADLRELLDSFSWRVTRPYRYLSQGLKNFVRSLKKNTVKLILKNPALHQTARDARAKIPGNDGGLPNSETRTDKFHFGLDSPNEEHKVFSESLTLRGWALTEASEVDITFFIDELEFRAFKPALSRPDVTEVYPWLPHAADCGFSEQINLDFLSSGAHTMTLVAKNAEGYRSELKQDFYLLEGNQIYSAWLKYQLSNDPQTAIGKALNSDQFVVHVIVNEGLDIGASLATLNSIAAQDWSSWKVHYLGNNWQEIQRSLLPEIRLALQEKTDVASSLVELLQSVNPDRDYLLGLNSGEQLFPFALRELIACAQAMNSDLVYSDHDTLNSDGIHVDPVFTFGWSPDHVMSRNYVGDMYLVRAATISLDFISTCKPSDWRYALLLHIGNCSDKIHRVASILWSAPAQAGKNLERRLRDETVVLEKHLSQLEPQANLTMVDGYRYIEWPIAGEPRVSIIIPTTAKLDLIKPCLDSLTAITAYENYEILMLDNSRGRNPDGIAYLHDKKFEVIECDETFNWSRLNNIGARLSKADYLLFLNDDIEIIDARWLHELLRHAVRPEVGAVGGLLLYPNGAIQHAGVFIINHGGGCAHLFHKMMPDEKIYRRLDRTVREVTANTGACLMLSRKKFEAMEGFDEELVVVGNDIDLCLRLSTLGYRNIWTPQCCLIHHESISRKASLPKADEMAMWKRWSIKFSEGDSYYNPNLSLEKWDCSLRLDMPAEELIADLQFDAQDLRKNRQLTLTPGVNLIGYIRAEMGVGEGARSDARALEAAAIDFGIINFETANPGRMTDLSWRHKEILSAPYDINLIHINADFLPLAKQELPAHFFKGRYNIAYWAWELEEIPREWIPAFEEIDEVWVPSEFVRQAMEKSSPVPVITIPHCIDLKTESVLSRSYFGIPESAFTFLTMFDTRSIAERKNPYGAVKAFKQAFAGNNKEVCLILKVNNAEEVKLDSLLEEIKSHPNILIMETPHSRLEINALLSLIDCFVSLHRSEGFGLAPAEAMCLGKATIITNWSGSIDYMTADNCKAIDFELIRIEKTLGPYKAGQRWAEPDLEQAAAAMRELAADPELTAKLGNNARETIRQFFSPTAVGKKMLSRLEEIRQHQESNTAR